MRKKKYHGRRSLLNLPGHQSTAAIVAEIEDTSTWKKGEDNYGNKLNSRWRAQGNRTFSISDCTRTVDLEVNITNEDDYNNALFKVTTMITALEEFKDGIIIERARYVERVKDIPVDDPDE